MGVSHLGPRYPFFRVGIYRSLFLMGLDWFRDRICGVLHCCCYYSVLFLPLYNCMGVFIMTIEQILDGNFVLEYRAVAFEV